MHKLSYPAVHRCEGRPGASPGPEAHAAAQLRQPQREQLVFLCNMSCCILSCPAVLTGVRVALEPPRGLKPTLLRSYASLPAGCLASCNSCGRGQQWQRLVFVTALLHGLLQVRQGPLSCVLPHSGLCGFVLTMLCGHWLAGSKPQSKQNLPSVGLPACTAMLLCHVHVCRR